MSTFFNLEIRMVLKGYSKNYFLMGCWKWKWLSIEAMG